MALANRCPLGAASRMFLVKECSAACSENLERLRNDKVKIHDRDALN